MYHATGATQQIFHHQQPQRPNKFGYLTQQEQHRKFPSLKQQEQRSKFSTINTLIGPTNLAT
jgi:hypothetical protein